MKSKTQNKGIINSTKEENIEKTPKKNTNETAKPVRKISTKRLIINLLIKISIIAVVIILVLNFVIGITINYGNNMHPAINDGDLVVSLRLQRPYLNAVVVYNKDGKKCVGRVIALPGNEVNITDKGELFVNGVSAVEDVYYPTFKDPNSTIKYPYTVEEGKAFILNDYREKTEDSRRFGTIDMDDIDGPLIFSLRRRGF